MQTLPHYANVTNLDPGADYEFRVLAANRAGLGVASSSCPPVQLRSRSDTGAGASGDSTYGPPPPGKPSVVSLEGDRAVIEWSPSPFNPDFAPVAGYIIEYRAAGTNSWIQSNDFIVTSCHYEVSNLRPNGEYEFRVLARSADGISRPSHSSGFYRIRPPVAVRNAHPHNHSLGPPGQPQVLDMDSEWVLLEWAHSASASHIPVSYSVECREIGDPAWYSAVSYPVTDNHLKVMHLRANSTYEFRVFTTASDGACSLPSDCSDVVQLRARMKPHVNKAVPVRPTPPEYLDFDGGSSVTLCWIPAQSTLPVLGYEVEFRDFQQDPTQWYKVTNQLIHSCKTIVGCLLQGHQYQFRIVAKNAVGFSEPSDPSSTITIGTSTYGHPKFVEAERHGSVTLLDEMIRESPPIPDRDDSPPPIHKKNTDLQWRDPTLKEVIDYLLNQDKDLVINASGYLQHLTFNDNSVKEETRNYGGIQNLIKLLKSNVPEIQRNACGCLKNLAYGKENDVNKKVINDCGGVAALADLLKYTQDPTVKEEATRVLWNMSSCDDVKKPILEQASDGIIAHVVVPSSGLTRRSPNEPHKIDRSLFGPGTGVLRNISAESITARQMLRHSPGLIEALLHFLREAVPRENLIDGQEVENVICILRNLSYRVQEVVDPDYNPNREAERKHHRERSKSAPSGSPKTKKKGLFKRKGKDRESTLALNMGNPDSGAALLWHTDTVKLYLKLLQDSSNSDTLEASAAAIQNLAACSFDPSVQVRSAVRTEKGLSVLVDLLRLKDDRVVCVVATALRNLSLDEKNRALIGKYAMKDLVSKLPRPDEPSRSPGISDGTIAAVLGILFEVVRNSVEFTKALHEAGGTDRLRKLAASTPTYSIRVCKYASQVLYVMWQHKELHDGFRRANLKEADFYSGPAHSRHSNTTTLARPISSQGPERPARLKSETLDDTLNSDGAPGTGRYGAMGSTHSVNRSSARYGDYSSSTPNSDRSGSHHQQHMYSPTQQYYGNYARAGQRNAYDQVPGEPLYASVKKQNGHHRTSTVGDSWV
ncbi:hypothetical protein QR680_003009 [Steinernema hermaphroditum]|uniref:Fibronectin type-III domain-containing protein n=1 Tax=Steinernema hermaphroditum TaxID=289476 RepID=A0AA39H530_9BILA|nr:hypothetical protein QR680_003009 [Steinernema hermaphroditum]